MCVVQTLIYLISRSDGKTVKTFKSDAFFYLHIINQYEEDDNVVIDICCYRDPSVIDCMFVEALQVIFNISKICKINNLIIFIQIVLYIGLYVILIVKVGR